MKNLKTFQEHSLNEAANTTIEYKGYSNYSASKRAEEKLSRLLNGEFSKIKLKNVDDPDSPPTHVGGIIKLTGPKDLLYKFCSANPPYPEWKEENPTADSL